MHAAAASRGPDRRFQALRIGRIIRATFANFLTSLCAGSAAFLFTLGAFLLLRDLNQQVVASLAVGLFALSIMWVAFEKPNSGHARAVAALIDRLLAVDRGDLTSPAPAILKREMPALAAAVDGLFEQVRSNLEDVNAMALYDPVTGLPNRVHFKREAERMLHARADGERMALLFVDLDGFKEVNDSLGHAQGDHVLCLVANRLRVVVKAETKAGSLVQPILARLAGDEFTLLFPGIRDAREAERIARRALVSVAEPFEMAGQTIHMGASIGIALAPRHGTDLTDLMKAADIAMYNAKASGRSTFSHYHPRLALASEEKSTTERELREALVRGEFQLACQPQVCARTGSVVAGEALIRWNHPTDGLRHPESFIRIAEESSLIVDIGDWVIDSVAATLRRWQDLGVTQRLSLNVSRRQLDRADFFKRLRGALARENAPAWMLELELSETLAMKCEDRVLAELGSLRAEGVSIAIDDFGSGYSNLVRLKDMPLDRVKLDRSLIDAVDKAESARTIVAASIHLIHGLGCEVVAEGVERPSQIDVLRAVDCDCFQGYAFAAPMAERDFLGWVEARGAAPPLARTA